MTATGWVRWADEQLDAVRAAGRWRQPRTLDDAGIVSFASNDYLGLTSHPVVCDAAVAAVRRWGAGSGSARLIVGSRPVHDDLEAALAAWKGTDRAVLFSTGFAANLGLLTVVGGLGTTILSDELNHASIVDGCRLARAQVAVYRHADVDHVEALLTAATGPAVVVTDAVFSMDGDLAPLGELAERCAARGALLVVDEAHSVLGPAMPPVDGLELVRVGTLSKTLGSLGGFVAGPAPLGDLLVNRARSYIFTTASSPADTAAALAALGVLRSSEGDALVARLRTNVDALRPGHPSPIVPIVVGGEREAVDLADGLLQRGFLVPAIRPPTVAPGTCRLRLTVSAAHTSDQIAALVSALGELGVDPVGGRAVGATRAT